MKKIYLCGNTGGENRGCAAIIASTAVILKKCGVEEIKAFTFTSEIDKKLGLNENCELIPYKKRGLFSRGLSYLEYKLFGSKEKALAVYHKELFKKEKDFITFNVGGDTYCCSTPYISYSLNNLAEKYDIPNIFWGCSVDETVIGNQRMIEDINKYEYIIIRESLTKEILEKVVKDKSKIYMACDPAFHLPTTKTALPENFAENNTVGINLSDLVLSDKNDENDNTYKNIYSLIDYIINETEMNVSLIPHVYNIERNSQDSKVLSKIYQRYSDSDRVSIVNRELTASELKFIISKCRFFIGARTHATIAAYSSAVPALALSYSIKSLGIAKDIFNGEPGFVISKKELKESDCLKNIFINTLLKNEEKIRKRYEEFLPDYKETIITVTKEVLGKIGI